MTTNHSNMQVGQKVWYTGDMANAPGYGEIVAIRPANKWAGLSYDILIEGERKFNGISPLSFAKSVGRRFWPAEEWEADRAARIEAFKAQVLFLKSWTMPQPKFLEEGK